MQQTLTKVFAIAEQEGEIPPGQDHAAFARLLSSVLDGASLALVMRPADADPGAYIAGVDLALDLIRRSPLSSLSGS